MHKKGGCAKLDAARVPRLFLLEDTPKFDCGRMPETSESFDLSSCFESNEELCSISDYNVHVLHRYYFQTEVGRSSIRRPTGFHVPNSRSCALCSEECRQSVKGFSMFCIIRIERLMNGDRPLTLLREFIVESMDPSASIQAAMMCQSTRTLLTASFFNPPVRNWEVISYSIAWSL